MFKIVAITLLLVAAASASYYNEMDNFIDYGNHYNGIEAYQPYVYQKPRREPVVVKKISPLLDDGHGHLLVPADLKTDVAEVVVPKLGLISTAVSFATGLIKKGIAFLFGNIPALVVGIISALGVCQFTAICGKLSALQSLVEVQREIRSLATPERVASATQFVENAIRKYRSLQDE